MGPGLSATCAGRLVVFRHAASSMLQFRVILAVRCAEGFIPQKLVGTEAGAPSCSDLLEDYYHGLREPWNPGAELCVKSKLCPLQAVAMVCSVV
jgi:hypothetical protein